MTEKNNQPETLGKGEIPLWLIVHFSSTLDAEDWKEEWEILRSWIDDNDSLDIFTANGDKQEIHIVNRTLLDKYRNLPEKAS